MRRVISAATRVNRVGGMLLGWVGQTIRTTTGWSAGSRSSRRGFDSVVGSDEEAACLLPVVISELVTGLERSVGRAEVEPQITVGWMSGPPG